MFLCCLLILCCVLRDLGAVDVSSLGGSLFFFLFLWSTIVSIIACGWSVNVNTAGGIVTLHIPVSVSPVNIHGIHFSSWVYLVVGSIGSIFVIGVVGKWFL